MEGNCYRMDCAAAKPQARGQGAMEYLMNYGWAILAVMVVGIMMWQLGYLDMHAETITVSGFSRLRPQLAGTRLATTGDFVATFTNAAGETVVIKDVTMTSDGVTNSITMNGGGAPLCTDKHTSWVMSTESCCAGNDLNACSASVGKGQNFKIHMAPDGLAIPFKGGEGDVYKMSVTVVYTSTISGIETLHTDSGVIRATYQND